MASSLETWGFEELVEALRAFPDVAMPAAKRAMDDSLRFMVGVLRPYPAQPPRNRARRFNTYVRGIGHFPRASFSESGERKQRGAYKVGERGGRVRRDSELLGNKWVHEVRPVNEGLVGILGNIASYSGAVQGRSQWGYHARTGWVTVDQALIASEPQIVRNFERALDETMEVLAGE